MGISTDAVQPQKAFADHCGLSFPLVADFPEFKVAKAFGVLNQDRLADSRTTFVIDREGKVQHIVEDPQNMDRHAEEALAILQETSRR